MSPNRRILTTHVGSLPRPAGRRRPASSRRIEGEHVDPAEYDRAIVAAVARPRAPPGRRGRRPRQRRRDEQDRLRDLHPPSAERVRGRRRAARDAGRPRRLSRASATAWRRRGATAKYLRPDLPRPDPYEHREPLERDLARLPRRSTAQHVGGRVHERRRRPGVIALFQPNEHYATLDEYLDALAEAMKVEYEAHRRRGLPAADRRAGPRDGPPHHVPRRARRGVRQGGRAPRRGDQPRAARTCPPTACGCTCAGATTRARTTSTSASRRSSTACCSAKPQTILFEAANPRHAHEWAVWRTRRSPTTRCSRRACSTRPRTTSSTRSSSPSASSRSPTSSAPSASWRAPTAASAPGSGFGPIDPTICWAKLRTMAEGAALASQRLF